MKQIAGLILIMLVAGCSDNTQKLQLPKLEGNPDAIQLVTSSWDKLLSHCPGLSKYQNDMVFLQITDKRTYEDEMARVDVEFKISNDLGSIPVEYRALGHTCRYGISPDGANVRIKKYMCVSVCLDRAYDETSEDYVARLE